MKLTRQKREIPKRQLNLPAMIDVVMLILIFFMVTSSFNRPEQHVDADVAAAMARAARLNLGADIGVGITGVAGPAEVDGKPVGTVHIAIDSERKSPALSVRFPPRRRDIKHRAAYSALFKIRQLLLDWT